MSYQTSSKLSRSFWLLIGARKLLCFSAQSEGRTAATVWNWSDKTRGSSRRSLLFFVPYFPALLDFSSPPLSPPGSPRMISSVSAMYRWILGQVLVRYRWCISWQSASSTVGRYVGRVMFYSRSRISQQNRLTVGHDSMGSALPVYWWTVGWLSVRYWLCISRQSI